MYYTLYDTQRDQVSRDRLALKLYIVENGKYMPQLLLFNTHKYVLFYPDHAEAICELDTMWHDADREVVDDQVIS